MNFTVTATGNPTVSYQWQADHHDAEEYREIGGEDGDRAAPAEQPLVPGDERAERDRDEHGDRDQPDDAAQQIEHVQRRGDGSGNQDHLGDRARAHRGEAKDALGGIRRRARGA